MRVLLLGTDAFSKGGIQRYTRYQYRALIELLGEDNVFLFSLAGRDKENSWEEDIKVAYVGKGPSLFSKICYVIRAIGFIKKNRISLLISTHVQLAIIGYLAKLIYGIPYYTNVYGLEIWSGLRKRDLVGLRHSDKLIGDCKFILNYVYDNLHFPAERSWLLYDPVDTARFAPGKGKSELVKAAYGLPNGRRILLTVGRLDRNKGHHLVIRSLAFLRDDVIYVVVGGGIHLNALRDLAERERVSNRVFFVGRVPDEDLVDFYNLSDIVILLSVFGKDEGEGLPLGLIEASACGKPIICGNEDGSREAVEDGVNGVIVSPRVLEDLVGKLRDLLRDPEKLIEMGRVGRQKVVRDFSYVNFKQEFSKIISGD